MTPKCLRLGALKQYRKRILSIRKGCGTLLLAIGVPPSVLSKIPMAGTPILFKIFLRNISQLISTWQNYRGYMPMRISRLLAVSKRIIDRS
jgi:hypothetical protein